MLKNKIFAFLRLLKEKRLTTVAGAWVYFFLSSLIPLIFLVITAFGVFGVEITTDLVARLPESLREGGTALVSVAKSAQEGITVLFIFSTILSLSSLLAQMRRDGNFIYGVEEKNKRGILGRLWAIVALLVLFGVFLAGGLLFAFGKAIFSGLPSGKDKLVLTTLAVGFLLTNVVYLVIVLLNKYICPIKIPLSILLLQSLVSLVIVFVGTLVIGVYIAFFGGNNAFYGSLAGIVAFLLWAYVCMNGLVIGAIFGYFLQNQNASSEVLLKKDLSYKREQNRNIL